MAALPREIYKRGKVLHYRFYMNNVEYRGSLHTDDASTAKLLLAEVKKQTVLGNVGIKKVPTFAVMSEKWLDAVSNTYGDSHIRTAKIFFTKHLNPVIGDMVLTRINTEIVNAVFNDFLATHSKGSANSLRKYLNIVFNHAIKTGYIKERPYTIKRYKITEKPKTLLDTSNMFDFIEYCYDNHNSKHSQTATMIAVAILTGMREGEVLASRWEWFNKTENKLTVVASKTGTIRTIPISEYLVGKISEYQEACGLSLGLMFPARDGEKHDRGFIYWAITRLAKRFGMTGTFGAHSCRHSFITTQHDLNTPIGDIAKLVGHEDLSTTAKYIHASFKGQKDAQDRLADAAGLNRTKTGTHNIPHTPTD